MHDLKTADDQAMSAAEDGMHQACEKLARKIRLRGPEYTRGDPHKIARARERESSRVSMRVHFPPGEYERIFGHK